MLLSVSVVFIYLFTFNYFSFLSLEERLINNNYIANYYSISVKNLLPLTVQFHKSLVIYKFQSQHVLIVYKTFVLMLFNFYFSVSAVSERSA